MVSSSSPPEVVIVGMGLIGGSLGLSLRKRGFRVCGIDRDPRSLRMALSRNAASRTASSIRIGAAGARLAVLAVPIQDMSGCLRQLSKYAPKDAVITDTASVKLPVLRLVAAELDRPERFVGAHPMAGSEKSGLRAASARLFAGRPCVITARSGTSRAAQRVVVALFRACGAKIVRMEPRMHDRAAALASHLPHAIANVLVHRVLGNREAKRLISGSFLDATRVTLSPERLWDGIFRNNAGELDSAIRAFSRELRKFGKMSLRGSRAGLAGYLSRTRRMRRAAIKRGRLQGNVR